MSSECVPESEQTIALLHCHGSFVVVVCTRRLGMAYQEPCVAEDVLFYIGAHACDHGLVLWFAQSVSSVS